MTWKDLSYWTKGGLILFFIHTTIFLIYTILSTDISAIIENVPLGEGALGLIIYYFLGFPLTFLLGDFLPTVLETAYRSHLILLYSLFFLINSLNWFIIGALIGWIYGKYKSR